MVNKSWANQPIQNFSLKFTLRRICLPLDKTLTEETGEFGLCHDRLVLDSSLNEKKNYTEIEEMTKC